MTDSKTTTLVALLSRCPMYRQLIPMEAADGWPWPRRGVDRSVCVAVPFFGVAPRRDAGPSSVFPPLAAITVRWSTGQPVDYRDYRFDNPWPEADWSAECDMFPHRAVAGLSGAEYQALKTEVHHLYDDVLGRLDRAEQVQPDLTAKLSGLLIRLTPPGLIPYYRKLAPGFFEHLFPSA